jgi:hypothetical protein
VQAELDGGATGLREVTRRLDARFGPYPEFADELAAIVRAAARGRLG